MAYPLRDPRLLSEERAQQTHTKVGVALQRHASRILVALMRVASSRAVRRAALALLETRALVRIGRSMRVRLSTTVPHVSQIWLISYIMTNEMRQAHSGPTSCISDILRKESGYADQSSSC